MTIILILISGLLGWLSYYYYPLAVTILAGLLPTYLLRTHIGSIPTTLLELSILAVTLGGLAQAKVRAQWRTAWLTVPYLIRLATLGFVVAATISAYISAEPQVSWGIWKSWVISPLLLGWLVYTVTVDTRRRLLIWRTLQWSALVVILFGLVINNQTRFTSIYDVPNSLALFLVPISAYSLWQRHRLISLILLVALCATQSVSGLITLGLTLLIGWLLWSHNQALSRRQWWLLIIILGSIAIFLASTGRLSYLLQPLHHGAPNSVSVRLQLWQASRQLIQQHPVGGLGLGQFEPYYQQWLHQQFIHYQNHQRLTKPLPEFVFRDPHNWFFAMWLNTGILGLGSWLVLTGYVLYTSWIHRHTLDQLTQATVLALISILLFGLADTVYWKNDLAGVYWILLSLYLRGLVLS